METIFPPVRRENLESGRRAGGRAGVGRERDRNKEGKLMIPLIHRDDFAVVVILAALKKQFLNCYATKNFYDGNFDWVEG